MRMCRATIIMNFAGYKFRATPEFLALEFCPDGGWGWIISFAAFRLQFIVLGLQKPYRIELIDNI